MHIDRQRPTTRLVTAVGLAVLTAAGMAAPAAAADSEPAGAPRTQISRMLGGVVTTWINGNVRYGPSTDYAINYPVSAGFTSYGLCWKTGGWVNANGVAHDKWVKLSDNEWIWGGLLNGDETGGVSNYC
ncbi:hypothetical protein [Streptomyces sp. BE303]|uniref:hypothetical protein n=2 Tax=Streptomycetaceae TaxID=2062 RepID=UPI002E774863|nr:hypothetical protein [Streptomyces sp. BE303]MED7949721.1 hypothetical protein [Streptomyces sp. BE303]